MVTANILRDLTFERKMNLCKIVDAKLANCLVNQSFVFNLLSYSSLLLSSGASVPSSSADVTMLQHIFTVCT